MIRWALALVAGPVIAQPSPPMMQTDCDLSYEIAASATQVPLTYETKPVLDDSGWCAVGGLALSFDPNILITVETIRWRVAGYERLNTLLPPTAVNIQIGNIRYIPQTDDPVMDYLFTVQSGGRGIDAALDIHWDPATQIITLTEASADLGYDNNVFLSGVVTGVDLGDMAGLQTSGGRATLTELDLRIASNGLFENYIAMPLGGALLNDAQDPASEVQRLKTLAIGVIDGIPGTILSSESANALRGLIDDMPHPAGILDLQVRSAAGLGMVTFAPIMLNGPPDSVDAIWPYLTDLSVQAIYTRSAEDE